MDSTAVMQRKHLSATANDVLLRCSQKLDTSVDVLVQEFETVWTPPVGDYSRKLVEYCSSKALNEICRNIEEQISDGSFSRFSFDMMLAWEKPNAADDEVDSESVAKGKEDKRVPTNLNQEQDEVSLFYSDIMPLLVDNEPSVGEDAFVWLATVAPIIGDVVNGGFTFECLTSTTLNRIYYPAYDKFLKEIDRCIKQLQNQATPTGVELADDEYILQVDGTASTSRVVRHIGGTSWPGRLTLTNYALYFEASGVVSYEDAIKLDLSKDIEQSAKPAATGPWGAPLFDKAIKYESSELEESIVLEFPEMTSSTRRDHWLALVKEVILLHWFISKFKVESPFQIWEMHARTILGIVRLHAAREMLRISPPPPKSFLIFSLLEVLPKGDIVIEELAKSITNVSSAQPCSASSVLRNLNVSQPRAPCIGPGEVAEGSETVSQAENLASLGSAIDQVREETREIGIAKATTEGLKDEGVSDSVAVLMELLKPIKTALFPWFQEVLTWQKPETTVVVIGVTLLVIYKEWIGLAIAALLLWVVGKMIWARRNRISDKYDKLVVCTASDKSAIESIVSAQHGLLTASEMMRVANISILKTWSIFLSKAPKHTDMVMMAATGLAIVVAMIPFKFILMVSVISLFTATSKLKLQKNTKSDQQGNKGSRRLKEWWDSIPVIPVEVTDKIPEDTT